MLNKNKNLNQNLTPLFQPQHLTREQFKQISSYMEKYTGIKMPISKQAMIQARLSNRLKALGFNSYSQYIEYAFSPNSNKTNELTMMVDLLTTNLTLFFRELPHFNFLNEKVLPDLNNRQIKDLSVWSAGCSSGEEPYSLAISINEFIRTNPNSFNSFSILATDLSTKVLNQAIKGIYSYSSIDKISYDLKKQYFLKSKDPKKEIVKIKKEIQSKVIFEQLNFMSSNYNKKNAMDIIFCRNVLIYFDKQTQYEVIKKLVDCLKPGGYLFLGHSETIFGTNLPLKSVSTTVFQKTKEFR